MKKKKFSEVYSITKILVCVLILIIIALVVVLINLVIYINSPKAAHLVVEGEKYTIEPGEIAYEIEENYWSFIKSSYIVIGSREDAQLYKIASEVPRNSYNNDNIVQNVDNTYRYYMEEDIIASNVAVDVSFYQSSIDWNRVKDSGVDIAIIRAGYRGYGTGALVTDDMFYNHIEGAIDAGLEVGVYFYSQALSYEEGVEEAQFVLSLISDYDVTYPLVFDTEYVGAEGARADGISNEDRTNAALGFLETVKNSGHTPMLYANRNWYAQNLDMSKLGDYRIWLAQYAEKPDFPYWYDAWQYCADGYVPGIDEEVDLNIWYYNEY